MRKNCWLVMALVLIIPAMMFTVSCAKKVVESKPAVSETPAQTQPAQDNTAAQEAERARIEAERLKMQQDEEARMAARNMFVNDDIHFDFDSSALLPAAQQTLSQKADYLHINNDAQVTIEGHCDERGTDAYNMALGERRAQAAKDFLVNLGVEAGRLDTISYGEERPVDMGHNEEAWAKNRRAHFDLK